MVVLVTCKNEEDRSKGKLTRMVTISLLGFSRSPMAANSPCPGRILPNFEPIGDFMVVVVTCIKKIQSEQKRLLYSQDFSHYNLLPLKPEF